MKQKECTGGQTRQVMLQGHVTGTCCRDMLHEHVAGTCCRDMLQGHVAGTGYRNMLEGHVAGTCCRNVLQRQVATRSCNVKNFMWWTLRQHVAEMCNGDKNHNVCTRTWKCCGNMSQGYVAVTSPLVYTDTFFTLGDILSLDMLHKVQLVELHGTHLGIKRCKDDIKLLVYGYATCPYYRIKC